MTGPAPTPPDYPVFAANWQARILARGPAEDCRVVAISLAGARIARTGTKPLPTQFRLVISEPRFTASCALMSDGGIIDVIFESSSSVPLPLVPVLAA